MPPLLLGAAYRDGPHTRQCADPEIVVVKMAAAECHPAAAGPVPILDPMGQRTYPTEGQGERGPSYDCGLLAGVEVLPPRGLYPL